MASNYSMGYHGVSSSSFPNLHMMSFQSGSMSSNPVGMPFGQPNIAGASPPVARTVDPSSSNVLRGAFSGLKWNPGLSQEWSDEEDAIVIEGLTEFPNECGAHKYIKIAARLNNKNVRDVALRCRWLSEKKKSNRRKPDDHVKKSKDKKEKVFFSQTNTNATVASPGNRAPNSEKIPSEAPVIDGITLQLLDENNHIIEALSSNGGGMQITEYAFLLFQCSRNLITIQQRMSQMPGMMRHMPPLPVSLDVDATAFVRTFLEAQVGLADDQLKQGGRF